MGDLAMILFLGFWLSAAFLGAALLVALLCRGSVLLYQYITRLHKEHAMVVTICLIGIVVVSCFVLAVISSCNGK